MVFGSLELAGRLLIPVVGVPVGFCWAWWILVMVDVIVNGGSVESWCGNGSYERLRA